ncbi:MAG: hypothetical protein FWE74_07765 [Oscillospiraceae bacterium]|nr:hypothetical protein [Oscillospiraceae bacterium]
MKNILDEIYYRLEESGDLERLHLNQAENKLLEKLNSEERELFDSYKEIRVSIELKDDRAAFRRGFRTCLQLFAEALF